MEPAGLKPATSAVLVVVSPAFITHVYIFKKGDKFFAGENVPKNAAGCEPARLLALPMYSRRHSPIIKIRADKFVGEILQFTDVISSAFGPKNLFPAPAENSRSFLYHVKIAVLRHPQFKFPLILSLLPNAGGEVPRSGTFQLSQTRCLKNRLHSIYLRVPPPGLCSMAEYQCRRVSRSCCAP